MSRVGQQIAIENGKIHSRRAKKGQLVIVAAFSAVASLQSGQITLAANSVDNVNVGTTADLGDPTNYSTGARPLTTADMVFLSSTYANTSFTLNTNALTPGTLNDLDATQSLSITGNKSITLSTASNGVSGAATDLLYVASGGNLTLAGTGGLVIGVNGNFDVVGTLAVSEQITGTKNVAFLGGGTTTLSGGTSAAPSAFTKFTVAGGTLNTSGFINASGSNVGVGDNVASTWNATGGNFTAAVGANTFFIGSNANGTLNVSGGNFTVLNALGSHDWQCLDLHRWQFQWRRWHWQRDTDSFQLRAVQHQHDDGDISVGLCNLR